MTILNQEKRSSDRMPTIRTLACRPNSQKINAVAAFFAAVVLLTIGCHAQSGNDSGISAAGELAKARAAHTATLTTDGSVLIVGGFAGGEMGIKETETFLPTQGRFTPGPSLSIGRSGHTATRLNDGRILVAGGFNGDYLDSTEIYDPKKKIFLPGPKLTMSRSEHVAILLQNGEVLLAGGVGTNWTFLATAEIYDPSTNSFRKTGAMTVERESHTATLLPDGTVLITGGHRGRRAAIEIFSSAEIFDPKREQFVRTADLKIKRHKHDAVLLPDGRVIIAGGSDERDSRGAYTSVETYDPRSKRFDLIGDMKSARYKHQGTTHVMKNGRVLFSGGAGRPEMFDPRNNSFAATSGDLGEARFFSTATPLADGRVLIVGGYNSRIAASSRAFVFGYRDAKK